MSKEFSDMLQFLKTIGRLKHLKRAGWAKRGINDCESVAGHMYRMAIITFLMPEDSALDRNRCMKMTLVHDIAECIVGDLTPDDGVSEVDKHRREMDALNELTALLPKSAALEILELFNEYEARKTPEAKFVKELDRFDMALQAFEYQQTTEVDLNVFFRAVEGRFQTPLVVNLKKALDIERGKVRRDNN